MQRKSAQMRRKQQTVLLCVLPFAAAGILLAVRYFYEIYLMPHMYPCILRTLTGKLCPACGMTHSVFALCRGDLAGAVRENAVIPACVLLALLWYAERWCKALGKRVTLLPRKARFWITLLALWLLYALLRNVL